MSNDILVAIGLVLVIEGLLWAVAPHLGRRMAEAAMGTPESQLRAAGVFAVALGVFLVWLVRG